MDAVGPEVDIVPGRQIPLQLVRVLVRPNLGEPRHGRGRQAAGVRPEQGRQRLGEVARGDALEVEGGDQDFEALRAPRIRRQERGAEPDAVGTTSVSKISARGSGRRRPRGATFPERRDGSSASRYPVARLKPAFAAATSIVWVFFRVMKSLFWRSVTWRPGTPALSSDSGKPKCCPTGHRRQEARGEIFARRRPETPVGLRPPSVPGHPPAHPGQRARCRGGSLARSGRSSQLQRQADARALPPSPTRRELVVRRGDACVAPTVPPT